MLNFARPSRKESGDTLIEVLFAIAVFSLVLVSALVLMNQGISASQRALEITLVRQQMDGQSEALRYLHGSYVEAYTPGSATTYPEGTPAEEYRKVIDFVRTAGRTSASDFGGDTCTVPADPSKDFVLNPVSATLVTRAMKTNLFLQPTTFAQLTYSPTVSTELDHSYGMWIEGVRSSSPGESAGYIDFHIRACWSAPGSSKPMNLGTIVRLYEPRG